MKFRARVEVADNGSYIAKCDDPPCTGRGATASAALEALREELRFRLELCPCSGFKENLVELDVVSRPSSVH